MRIVFLNCGKEGLLDCEVVYLNISDSGGKIWMNL